MSIQEFHQNIQKGQKLWILNDSILDLTEFAARHPGGRFVIDRTVGRDVSKYFYGSYALDHNSNDPSLGVPSHIHSNSARGIAQECAVAILSRNSKERSLFSATINSQLTRQINGNTKVFVFEDDGHKLNTFENV